MSSMTTFTFRDKPGWSIFSIFDVLWKEYQGERKSDLPFSQQLDMLQEIIRKTMREEHESYLAGRCTAGRVRETQGHAVLVGKLKAEYLRDGALLG